MKTSALKKFDETPAMPMQAEIHAFVPLMTVMETMAAMPDESKSCDYEEFLSQYGDGSVCDFA